MSKAPPACPGNIPGEIREFGIEMVRLTECFVPRVYGTGCPGSKPISGPSLQSRSYDLQRRPQRRTPICLGMIMLSFYIFQTLHVGLPIWTPRSENMRSISSHMPGKGLRYISLAVAASMWNGTSDS